MAFTEETGTGIKGANAYGSVVGFKAYFDDRPEDISAIIDTTIEDLLVCATDYIDTRWGLKFLGRREFTSMLSRSVLTITAQPADGETVTFGANTYTFRTTPTDTTLEPEIGTSLIVTLFNLASTIGGLDTEDFGGHRFADLDIAAVTLFANSDGVATTEALTAGDFDAAVTAGLSNKRQSLEFPRSRLKDRRGDQVISVPDLLKFATFEYAFRANTVTLAPDPTVDASGLTLTKNRVVVGPIETELEFSGAGTIQITKPFPTADRMLREYVRPGGVIRA